MNKNRYETCSLALILSLLLTGFPAYADASSEITENPYPKFVDKNKDPQYYIDRYYNEIEYRAWFDRNYPNYTIEEAVGYFDIETNQKWVKNELMPEAQALSTNSGSQSSENGEIAQTVLAISALVILFGATYGIKKKVDNNSRQISINKNTIKQKIIKPIIGSDPCEILQTRLAKGEITLEEYKEIKNELNPN